MTPRSFPLPWSSEEHSGHLVVKDKNGQAIACVYYENAAGRRLVLGFADRSQSSDAHIVDMIWS
jgi:hypothetical protein